MSEDKVYLRCNSCGTRWPDDVAIPIAAPGPGCCQSPNIHAWDYAHKWAQQWPGNFCVVCGIEDPVELAMCGDPDFFLSCPKCLGVPVVAEECNECDGQGCVINQSRVPAIPPCQGPNGTPAL